MWKSGMKTPNPNSSLKQKSLFMQAESEHIAKKYLNLKEKNRKLELSIEKKKFSSDHELPLKKVTRKSEPKCQTLSLEPKDTGVEKKLSLEGKKEPAQKKKDTHGKKVSKCLKPGCQYETCRSDNFQRHLLWHKKQKSKEELGKSDTGILVFFSINFT